MIQRELTGAEQRALNLLKIFEKACDDRRLCVQLSAGEAAAKVLHKLETDLRVCRTISVNHNKATNYYDITFTTGEFRRYLDFILTKVGMKLMIDGSLKTFDGLTISNEYLN